ncbi:MAG: hypothetical protein JWN41_1769 [Thermoleophilia bacterium]|nr:hypothetical protein [Thermoleophilia bacterium]
MSEGGVKERVAISRMALLREMGVDNSASKSAELLTAHVSDSTPAADNAPVKLHSFWIALGKKTVSRWWSHHPLNFALQATQPVVHLYAKKNPFAVIATGAAAGAILYIFRPWRLMSVTSLAVLFLRASAIPKVALDLVQASQQKGLLQPSDDELPIIRSQSG